MLTALHVGCQNGTHADLVEGLESAVLLLRHAKQRLQGVLTYENVSPRPESMMPKPSDETRTRNTSDTPILRSVDGRSSTMAAPEAEAVRSLDVVAELPFPYPLGLEQSLEK